MYVLSFIDNHVIIMSIIIHQSEALKNLNYKMITDT